MKLFNKIIGVVAVMATIAIIRPHISKAATVQDLETMIKQLQAQIANLQIQLQQQKSGETSWCHNFKNDLKLGSSGSEVAALQIILEKEGFNKESNIQEDKDKSYFGEETASAVSGLQQKYKDEILTPLKLNYGTGYIGKATRAKLNSLYGCGISYYPECPSSSSGSSGCGAYIDQTPIVTAVSSKGGSDNQIYIDQIVYVSGTGFLKNNNVVIGSYSVPVQSLDGKTLKFSLPSSFSAGQYGFTINNTNGTSASRTVEVFVISAIPMVAISISSPNGGESWYFSGSYNITWQSSGIKTAYIYLQFQDGGMCYINSVNASLGQYAITPTENQSCPNISKKLSEGKYKVVIYTDNASAKDSSDNLFSIFSVSGSTFQAPVVTSVSSKGGSENEIYTDQVVYVAGTGFLTDNTVKVGSYSIPVQSTDGTTIRFSLPSSFSAGQYNFSISNTNGTSASRTVTVLAASTTSAVTITSFTATNPSTYSNQSTTLSWQTSASTDASVDFICSLGSIRFYIKEGGTTVGCDKGGLASYINQSNNTISFVPQGNTASTSVDFILTLLKEGVPTGQSKKLTIVFAPATAAY